MAHHRARARKKETDKSADNHCSVALVGGGLTTYMMAVLLQHTQYDFVWFSGKKKPLEQAGDLRTTTVHHAGKVMLETLGLWPEEQGSSWPLSDIYIGIKGAETEHRQMTKATSGSDLLRQNWPLHWHHHAPPMGYVVSNAVLFSQFEKQIAKVNRLEKNITQIHSGTPARLVDSDGMCWTSDLIIACDGPHSQLREQAGLKTYSQRRGQSAIVTNINAARPINNSAWQVFLPEGPLAIMATGPHQGSVVWTVRDDTAQSLSQLSETDFNQALRSAFGPQLGRLSVTGDRLIWPLQPNYVPKLSAPGFLLAGDSAHALHPLAGMGYNLALSDGAVLLDCLQQAGKRGLPSGHISVTQSYERRRRKEILAMTSATQILDRLLSQPAGPLSAMANIGMSVLGRSSLRHLFSKIAMGGILAPAPLFEGRLWQ